jgi:hypothetical protein
MQQAWKGFFYLTKANPNKGAKLLMKSPHN